MRPCDRADSAPSGDSVLPCRADDPTTTAAGPADPRRAEGPGGPIRADDPARPRSRASSSPSSALRRSALFVGHPERLRRRSRAACRDVAEHRGLRPRRGLDRRLGRRNRARHLRRRGPARDRLRPDPAGHASTRRSPPRTRPSGRTRASTSAASCAPCSRTSRPARPSRAPRPSASSWSACASSTPSSWPIRSARSSARSRRRSSRCASTTATRATEGKQRILEMYLNQVYYGNNAYGIWAAANAYFGKDLTSDAPGGPADDQRGGHAGRAGARAVAPGPDRRGRAQRRSTAGRAYVVPRHGAGHHRPRLRPRPDARVRASSPRPSTTPPWPRRSCWRRPRDNAYLAPHFVFAVRREAERAARGRGAARHRRAARSSPRSTTRATRRSPRSGRRSATTWTGCQRRGAHRDRYGEAALAWIRQLQGRNINNDAIVTVNYRTGRRAGLRRLAPTSTARRRPSTSRTSTSSARRTASPDRPSSRSPTRPASSPATITPGDDVHGRRRPRSSTASAPERRQPRARPGPRARRPEVLAQHPGHQGAAAHRLRRAWWTWPSGSASSAIRATTAEVAVPSLTLGTLGIHQLDLAGAYGAIANGGRLDEPYLIERIEDSRRQRHLRPRHRCRRRRAGPLGRIGLPRHRHPGRQHRSGRTTRCGARASSSRPMAAAGRPR